MKLFRPFLILVLIFSSNCVFGKFKVGSYQGRDSNGKRCYLQIKSVLSKVDGLDYREAIAYAKINFSARLFNLIHPLQMVNGRLVMNFLKLEDRFGTDFDVESMELSLDQNQNPKKFQYYDNRGLRIFFPRKVVCNLQ